MSLIGLVLLTSCGTERLPQEEALYAGETLGDAAALMDPTWQVDFDRGRALMSHTYTPDEGLGPAFNADQCGSCHVDPVLGGSGPRGRDYFLVWQERFDGLMEPVGTNGESAVRALYAVSPVGHPREPDDIAVFGRRATPTALGAGLFAFVPESVILANEDPIDEDGDGISGRANYQFGAVGRFGYKAQAATLESFIRGLSFNQMGLTSNPVYFSLPDEPDAGMMPGGMMPRRGVLSWLASAAYAQASSGDAPTADDDAAPDPELGDADLSALLVYSTFLGAPHAAPPTEQTTRGQVAFADLGCTACHVPFLESTLGRLPAWSDLLLHDMGRDMDDGVVAGIALEREFRTQPLWGVAVTAPYLHDGRAQTLSDAIRMHGGEAQTASDAFSAASSAVQADLLAWLDSLGGQVTPDVPGVGSLGGPDIALNGAEAAQFAAGRAAFSGAWALDRGVGPAFDADACGTCHADPVLGGAGGADTAVLRMGAWSDDGQPLAGVRHTLPRLSLPGEDPIVQPAAATVVVPRQTPSLLGVGLLSGIADTAILANEDPEDTDGDGVSGRARRVGTGIGHLGWRAQFADVAQAARSALSTQLGLTVASERDDDGVSDPEVSEAELVAWLSHLAAPAGVAGDDATVVRGREVFTASGCDACHLPLLDGVPAFTDLLLHDLGGDPRRSVPSVDDTVLASEYRTPALWGISASAPYLHDGSAADLPSAVAAHAGEGTLARDAVSALSSSDRDALWAFLDAL